MIGKSSSSIFVTFAALLLFLITIVSFAVVVDAQSLTLQSKFDLSTKNSLTSCLVGCQKEDSETYIYCVSCYNYVLFKIGLNPIFVAAATTAASTMIRCVVVQSYGVVMCTQDSGAKLLKYDLSLAFIGSINFPQVPGPGTNIIFDDSTGAAYAWISGNIGVAGSDFVLRFDVSKGAFDSPVYFPSETTSFTYSTSMCAVKNVLMVQADTYPGMLAQVATGTLSYTSPPLVFNNGENNAFAQDSLVCTPSYVFAMTNTGEGTSYLVKAQISPLAYVQSMPISPGMQGIALSDDGNFLFAPSGYDAKMFVVNVGTFSLFLASSQITGCGGRPVILSSNTVYVGQGSSGGFNFYTLQFTSSSGGGGGSAAFPYPIQRIGRYTDTSGATTNFGRQIASASDGSIFATSKHSSGSTMIIRFNDTSGTYATQDATLVLPAPSAAGTACAIPKNGVRALFVGVLNGTQPTLYRIEPTGSMSIVGSMILELGISSPSSAFPWIEVGKDFLFTVVSDSGARTTMVVRARVDLLDPYAVAMESLPYPDFNILHLSSTGLQLFVGSSNTYPAELYSFTNPEGSSFQVDRWLTLTSAGNIDYRMADDGQYLFFFAQSTPVTFFKVHMSTMSVVFAIDVGSSYGISRGSGLIIDTYNSIGYFAARMSDGSPFQIWKFNITSSELSLETTAESAEIASSDLVTIQAQTVAVADESSVPNGLIIFRRVASSATTVAPTPGTVTPILPYTPVTVRTSITAAALWNLESLEGNIFYPMGYQFSSCNNSAVVSNSTQHCVDDFHACHENQRYDLGGAVCPQTLSACINVYSQCLIDNGQTLLTTTTTSCPWAPAFYSAGIDAVTSGNDLYDCAVFVKTFAASYYKCLPMIDDICADVISLFAQQAKNAAPTEISKTTLTQTSATKFPRGTMPIVIAKASNDTTCSRPYFDGTCGCPTDNGKRFDRLRLYEPSYLFAPSTDTDKKRASNYDVCYDRGVSEFENVSFTVTTFSTGAAANRLLTTVQCVSPKTLRELKVLAESGSSSAPTGMVLAMCAPEETNVFIVNSITGSCYSPRVNVSCSCGVATSVGISVVYLNETTNEALTGTLIICNYPLPKTITQQQVITTTLTATASALAGPAAQGMQAAAIVSLLDCNSDESSAQEQGGRFTLIPGAFGDSDASGLIFLFTVIIGCFLLHTLIAFVLACLRWRTACCDYCSGHSKGHPIPSINVKREKYVALRKLYDKKMERRKKDENNNYDKNDRSVAIEVIRRQPDDDDHNNNNLVKKNVLDFNIDQDDVESIESSSTTSTNKSASPVATSPSQYQDNSHQKKLDSSVHVDDADTSTTTTTTFLKRTIEKTKDQKHIIITTTDTATGVSHHKTLVKRFRYRDVDSIKLGFGYHFSTACATLRLPGLFEFFILRYFFPGLAYESVYLLTRHSAGWIQNLAILGLLLTLGLLIYFITIGILVQRGYCPYTKFERLYKNWPAWAKKWIAYDGEWPDTLGSFKHGLVFDDYSGNCKYPAIIIPANYVKAFLLALLTAIPWSDSFCPKVYYILIGIFFLWFIVFAALLPTYRSFMSSAADMYLSLLTGLFLLLFVLEKTDAANTVYLAIVYGGMVWAVINQAIGFHEMILEDICGVEESDRDEDWETDPDQEDEEELMKEPEKIQQQQVDEPAKFDEDENQADSFPMIEERQDAAAQGSQQPEEVKDLGATQGYEEFVSNAAPQVEKEDEEEDHHSSHNSRLIIITPPPPPVIVIQEPEPEPEQEQEQEQQVAVESSSSSSESEQQEQQEQQEVEIVEEPELPPPPIVIVEPVAPLPPPPALSPSRTTTTTTTTPTTTIVPKVDYNPDFSNAVITEELQRKRERLRLVNNASDRLKHQRHSNLFITAETMLNKRQEAQREKANTATSNTTNSINSNVASPVRLSSSTKNNTFSGPGSLSSSLNLSASIMKATASTSTSNSNNNNNNTAAKARIPGATANESNNTNMRSTPPVGVTTNVKSAVRPVSSLSSSLRGGPVQRK